ncbi:MAG: 2-oxoacid:acceptor oxidoreductase family protein [Minisyncoccia bacterium]
MKKFNLIIGGVGGQGQITLMQILANACLLKNFDVKSSEVHGLSQRRGSVEVHLRFGKNIFSPLVKEGDVDLVIALEKQEALRLIYYGNKDKTIFLINDFNIPIIGGKNLEDEYIKENLKKFSKDFIFVPATKICEEKLKNQIVAGTYLISYASYKKLIPIEIEYIEKSIKEIIKPEFIDINLKASELAKS